MIASADSTIFSTQAMPSGFFKSTAIARRPRDVTASVPVRRPSDWARSTRTTSAPMSERSSPANGPGPIPPSSMILTPLSGPTMPPRRLPVPCALPSHVRREATGARYQEPPPPPPPPPPEKPPPEKPEDPLEPDVDGGVDTNVPALATVKLLIAPENAR